MVDGIKIDRSRITHGEAKQATLLQMKAARAQRDLDVEAAEECLQAADALLAKVVVSVPDGWLPDGIKIGTKGWLDHLPQPLYEELMQAAQPANPGEKKA